MFVMEYVQFQLYQELKMAINNFICIIKIRIFRRCMFIYGGNMKKQKIFLKNKQLLGFYLVVGVLFSVISVVAPSISGELVNAVIYRQGDVKVYLFLLVLTYILLLLFSIADQYFFQYFQIKEKNAMRNELFQASLKRGNQEKEQIAAFTSFVNNDVPNIVENYYGGTVDIIKCVCIIICNGVQREHNKKLNNGLPILHKVPPK